MDIAKMKESLALLTQARDALDDANPECVDLTSVFGFRDLIEDLEMDIARAEGGDLD